jgi:hypothetical protein
MPAPGNESADTPLKLSITTSEGLGIPPSQQQREVLRDNQDENAPSNRMRIARGFGGAGRSPEPT